MPSTSYAKDVNGITIGYEDRGAGAPLVLVHGHPFDRTMWTPQIETFGAAAGPDAGWRVIAPDLRGYGTTTVVPGITYLETFAHDLAALLDALGLAAERIVLGGLSMGGQIVMEFARLFPQRLRGLVLADTFARGETPEGRAIRNAIADRLLGEGMAGYTDEVLDKMVARYNIERQPEVAAHVRRMMLGAPPAGAAAALRGRAERLDYTELLGRITVPTLVVVGEDDEYTPVSDAEFLHWHIPDATLTVIDDAAHMPNLEQPGQFNEALAKFLATLP
ncbi:alpha/beta fold hydrolase [Streptomyces piniterrae]|uniref:alpha/beta fold hydrolase n=1 Tax=Streptomyces piniterrae TaxID=2571125 RepID=UPI001FEB6E5C|nr:alpha/beta hydrolase [Streptomyces piniterrae]